MYASGRNRKEHSVIGSDRGSHLIKQLQAPESWLFFRLWPGIAGGSVINIFAVTNAYNLDRNHTFLDVADNPVAS